MAVKNSHPKAIETIYKNTRFRSRLEAKWALFFDELGIVWDYECEGFEGRGIRYLPDFFLPELGYFFEEKPYAPTQEEFYKSAICVESSGKPLILSWGYPHIPWAYGDDGDNFKMISFDDFLRMDVKKLPNNYIKYPSVSDRFGMVGIDDTAARTLLGDFDGIILNRQQFFVGGLETAEICRCASCHKFYFDAEFNTTWTYDAEILCPFGCERDSAKKYVAAAANKARNYRFGKIA